MNTLIRPYLYYFSCIYVVPRTKILTHVLRQLQRSPEMMIWSITSDHRRRQLLGSQKQNKKLTRKTEIFFFFGTGAFAAKWYIEKRRVSTLCAK